MLPRLEERESLACRYLLQKKRGKKVQGEKGKDQVQTGQGDPKKNRPEKG